MVKDQINNDEASGCDGLPAELYEAGGEGLVKQNIKIFSTVWKSGKIPKDMEKKK